MRKLKTSLDLIALRSNRKDILPKVAQSPENTKKQKEIRKVYNNKFTIPLLTKLNTSHDRSLSMDGRKFNTNVSHSRSNSKTMTPRISNPITPRTYNDGTMSRASNVTNKSRKYTTPLKKDQQLIEKFKTVIPNITTIEAKS